jgi:hypothetical protein
MSDVLIHRQIKNLLPALLFAALTSFAVPVFAQPLPVAINTTRIEITASPGEKASSSFTFWNGTDEFLPIHLEGADIAPQDEEGHVTVGEKIPEGNSLKEWLHPELNDFAVAPKQEFLLKFTVDVPTTADPGTHYGALLVATAPVTQAGGAAVQTKIGPIILVKVLGDVKEKLTLESFTMARFTESPPIALKARFKNEGTVHEAPSGSIEVLNMFGGLVATGTLPVLNVLPGAVRKIESSVGDGLWLGRYTVLFRAAYGVGGEELDAKRIIWVVPWRTQGWRVLLMLGLVTWAIVARRRFKAFFYVLKTGLPPPNNL